MKQRNQISVLLTLLLIIAQNTPTLQAAANQILAKTIAPIAIAVGHHVIDQNQPNQ